MRHIIFHLFFLLSALASVAQVNRAVGVAGGSATSSTGDYYHISVGQVDFIKAAAPELIVTEGFNQPKRRNPLTFEWRFESPECSDFMDGKIFIENIEGAGCDVADIQFAWNGVTGAQTLTGVSQGSYIVQARTADNCYFKTNIEIIEDDFRQDCGLEFPTAFVSGLSGRNAYWHIGFIEEAKYQPNRVEIYNRWGQKIWEGENYDNETVFWSGTDKDRRAITAGTYFYSADVNGKIFTGYIEVLK